MKKLIAILLLFAAPALADINTRQAKACHTTSGTSATCSYGVNVSSRSLLVVACAGSSLIVNLNVTDDEGDSYTLVGGTTTTDQSGNTLSYGVWYSSNVIGDFTTTTCQDLYGNVGWIEMSQHEYTGAAWATDPLDVYSSSAAAVAKTTTTVVSGYATPSISGAVAFGFAPKMGGAATAGNGTIQTNSVDNAFWATEDAIITPATVYQSSFTFTSAGVTNNMIQVFFKPPQPAPRGVEQWIP